MSNPTPFYELPRPERQELVITARWIAATEEGFCTQLIGHDLCLMQTEWQCYVCGQWTCDLHEAKKKAFHDNAICENCAKLSPIEQERVFVFREEMNR